MTEPMEKETQDVKKEHVVLVHGLYMHGTGTKVLASWLRKAGFSTSEFSYRTVKADLKTNAEKLHEHMLAQDADVVNAVGHSLGGVLLQQVYDTYNINKPGRVVALGSPFLGSQVARYLHTNPMASAMLGKSMAELLQTSDSREWTTDHDLGIIAGTVSVGLGSVFPKMLESPNDGTVAVSETKLPGYKEHITVPVSHTALIFSSKTSDKVISFLKTGHFEDVHTT